MTSRIYFPLRANAHSLVAGAPAAAVRRRLIVASLLHDEVILDDGTWSWHAGPSGRMEFHDRAPFQERGFQTSRERARAKRGKFWVAMSLTGSTSSPHTMIHSDTTIAWQATFGPLKREMGKPKPWIEFVKTDLYPDDKKIVGKMVVDDAKDGLLDGLIPNEFSRVLVIGNANFAMVMGARMDAAISMDEMHRRVLYARMTRGQATPVFGSEALTVLFPGVDTMTWDDVDDARRLPGMRDLRALLAEIEEAAWSEAESERSLESAIHEAYQLRFHEAAAKLAPSFRGTIAGTTIGVGISLITGPLAVPVAAGIGAATDAAGAVAGRLRYERSWLAAGDRLTRRATSNRG